MTNHTPERLQADIAALDSIAATLPPSAPITAAQMRWAASHDWYSNAELLTTGAYLVWVYTDSDYENTESFANFTALTNWAGY